MDELDKSGTILERTLILCNLSKRLALLLITPALYHLCHSLEHAPFGHEHVTQADAAARLTKMTVDIKG